MKYLLAVSGGVDSMVLLDVFRQKFKTSAHSSLRAEAKKSSHDFVVATFDHGIRGTASASDAEFVKNYCDRNGIKCVVGHAALGENASEAEARAARYDFLEEERRGVGADLIVTAHHEDDLLETIVMNLIRGTEWRGLAPFYANAPERRHSGSVPESNVIFRPLLNHSKAEVVAYALGRGLEWREDATNYSFDYFRNRVRLFLARKMTATTRKKLLELYHDQVKIRRAVEEVLNETLATEWPRIIIDRVAFKSWPENVRREILGRLTGGKLTRRQVSSVSDFIATALPAKSLEYNNVKIRTTKNTAEIVLK